MTTGGNLSEEELRRMVDEAIERNAASTPQTDVACVYAITAELRKEILKLCDGKPPMKMGNLEVYIYKDRKDEPLARKYMSYNDRIGEIHKIGERVILDIFTMIAKSTTSTFVIDQKTNPLPEMMKHTNKLMIELFKDLLKEENFPKLVKEYADRGLKYATTREFEKNK